MIPKTALLTGNLLEWQKANIKALLVMFEKHYGKESGDYDFWGWMYERLERNQKHVKQSLKLGHFFPCKDGKPLSITEESFYLESPENQKAFEQAEKEVLFEGWILESKFKSITIIRHKDYGIFEFDKAELIATREIPRLPFTVQQLITQIPQINITDNYYNETFKN